MWTSTQNNLPCFTLSIFLHPTPPKNLFILYTILKFLELVYIGTNLFLQTSLAHLETPPFPTPSLDPATLMACPCISQA